MEWTVQQIAALLNGEIEGDPQVKIAGPSKIEEGKPGTISFLANPKYEAYAYQTNASALLVSRSFAPAQKISATLIRVDDVYGAITTLLGYYEQKKNTGSGKISEQAFIHPEVQMGEGVSVGPFAVIEQGASIGGGTIVHPQVYIGPGARIGENVLLYPGVRIYADCVVGDRCIIHSNAVIGSDGFGFSREDSGEYRKIPQIGNAVLEEDVEIGANTVIDRATMGSTIIRKGCKLDNLIQIAHNVEVGENTVMAAQVGIAGSTKIGQGVQMGGQVGIVGHVRIADGVKLQAKTGVGSNLDQAGEAYGGFPAIPHGEFLRAYLLIKRLPEMFRKLAQLEKKVENPPN